MIRKTVKEFRRLRPDWEDGTGKHPERVLRETWWVLWVIPVYQRTTITSSGL